MHNPRGRSRKQAESAEEELSRLRMENELLKKIHAELRKDELAKRNIGLLSDTKRDLNVELLNPEYRALIAVGGDGLVNLCVQYVAQKPISLGVLPAGTGNDFARAVGAYRKSTEEIFWNLYQTKPDSIDLGLIESNTLKHWYVQVLSTGFDALVNSQANEIKWPKGKSKYTIATILTLARFKPIAYRLTIDKGYRRRCDATFSC